MTAALLTQAGCGSRDDDGGGQFSFGAAEMKAAAGGDWTGTLTLTSAPETTYQLHLEYQSPGGSQPACDSRTLASPACITMSGMGFTGVLSSADKSFAETPVTASFEVFGEDLESGSLSIDADTRSLVASYAKAAFSGGQVTDGGAQIGTFTMKRP